MSLVDEIAERAAGIREKKWNLRKLGLGRSKSEELIKVLMKKLRRDCRGSAGAKQRGHILCVTADHPYPIYRLLDDALSASEGAYIVFGIHLSGGCRVRFFRWERLADGTVRKLGSNGMFSLFRPLHAEDYVLPLMRGMMQALEGTKVEFHAVEGDGPLPQSFVGSPPVRCGLYGVYHDENIYQLALKS